MFRTVIQTNVGEGPGCEKDLEKQIFQDKNFFEIKNLLLKEISWVLMIFFNLLEQQSYFKGLYPR